MRVYIKTYGCQMNERDSEAMMAKLIASGHAAAATEEEADILIFNTCSVRDAAERKAKGKISHIRKLKQRNPNLVIGIAGCMAQRLGGKLLEELPHVDFVIGTGQLHRIQEIVGEAASRRMAETMESPDVLTGMGEHLPGNVFGQIAITRGCNRFCSYCIVPYVRGREISRDRDDIVREAREMVESGTRELLLLGQNVAAYGLGGDIRPPRPGHSPFAELLEDLDAIDGLERIRFTSPYVTYFNDRLVESISKCRKVCHCIHLPLQSSSDRVLREMNRQYTADIYREHVAAIRRAVPDVAFSTDVIVGFPGETDEDFAMTRDLMNEIGYSQSYIFKYSPRPGAKSAAIEDSVPEEVKERRNQILLGDLAERVAGLLAGQVGATVEVLVEGVSARNAERWSGRTGTGYMVHFLPDDTVVPGQVRHVKVTRSGGVSLFGELLK